MRFPVLPTLLMAISIAAIAAGCGKSSSSSSADVTAPASSAPGTVVRQPLGASSVNGAGSAKPAH